MFSNRTIEDIYKKYRENKLAHAYLIETNNIEYAINDLKELIKAINCPNKYNKDCTNCNLCNLINKGNLPSLIIIEPDGASIKKAQIEDLKVNFSSVPVYSKFNIYIIKECEKLNGSSANAMLKFVEEPTDGILGFFITTNKDVLIDTIKSRCQTYVMNYENESILENININSEDYNTYTSIIKKYLELIDTKELINHKKEILSVLPEKEQVIKLLKFILEIYHQNLLKTIGQNYDDSISSIYNINENFKEINKKMQIISKILQEMSYNVSIELILDKFVLEMRGQNG